MLHDVNALTAAFAWAELKPNRWLINVKNIVMSASSTVFCRARTSLCGGGAAAAYMCRSTSSADNWCRAEEGGTTPQYTPKHKDGGYVRSQSAERKRVWPDTDLRPPNVDGGPSCTPFASQLSFDGSRQQSKGTLSCHLR